MKTSSPTKYDLNITETLDHLDMAVYECNKCLHGNNTGHLDFEYYGSIIAEAQLLLEKEPVWVISKEGHHFITVLYLLKGIITDILNRV